MKIGKHHRPLTTNADHNCFACSPSNAAGLQMAFFAYRNTVFSRVTIPEHLGGWNRVAHGGVVSTVLDETMCWAAMVLLKRLSFTQKMSVEFMKTVAVGATMETESRVLEVRENRMAVVDGILTDLEGNVCAVSQGTFRIFRPSVARRLNIADDKMLTWFDQLIGSA